MAIDPCLYNLINSVWAPANITYTRYMEKRERKYKLGCWKLHFPICMRTPSPPRCFKRLLMFPSLHANDLLHLWQWVLSSWILVKYNYAFKLSVPPCVWVWWTGSESALLPAQDRLPHRSLFRIGDRDTFHFNRQTTWTIGGKYNAYQMSDSLPPTSECCPSYPLKTEYNIVFLFSNFVI